MDQLFARVQEHDDSIVRLDATIEKNAVSSKGLAALLLAGCVPWGPCATCPASCARQPPQRA